MLSRNEPPNLIEILRNAEMERKRRLDISSDQTFLKRFVKRNYETHKIMKNVIISELITNGIKLENILVEKPFKGYAFRPDITVFSECRYIFFECHYHDGFNRCITSHIYNNIELIKKLGKIVICMYKNKRRNVKYIRNHKILSKVNEVWLLDSEKNIIEKIIN